MKTKKTLSLLLSLIMTLSFVIPVSAISEIPESGQTIFFDESKYTDISLEAAGAEKLRDSGYSQNLIDSMPAESLRKIGASPKAQQSTSYYMEIMVDDGSTDLVRISETEYETALEAEMQARANKIASQITVIGKNGNVLYSPESIIAPLSTTTSLDGGKLSVVTTLYQITDGQLSQYMVVSEYSWTTPPEYRGSDYFGITRDSNCSVIPDTFGNTTYYKEYRYYYLATNSGVQSVLNSTNDHNNDNLDNEDSAAKGFVIKIGMPVDVNPPASMLVGSSFLSRNYANMNGAVWYQGVLQSPSIAPQNFNHFSTYWHQKSTKLFGSFSLNIPFGASFTVSPESKFSTPVEDTILTTWNKS